MCYKIKYMTYLEGENSIIVRDTKRVKYIV